MVQSTIRARNITDPRVLDAMSRVPRHEFVPHYLRHLAYSDQPLPIGQGQTISQPYIVALMTEWAALKPGDRCLEIGTGCGYQTAVLAEVGASIVTVEINPTFAAEAKARLRRLGYSAVQVQCHTADGSMGWPDAAPYDAIIVTAAAAALPDKLLSQLADNGRLILPIGPQDGIQRLEKWFRQKQADGPATFESTFILNVQFVPLQSRT
jgi:protein-L-isoaspartate(D-aspartate) O-methyltransferase